MIEVALSDFTPSVEPLSKATQVKHANISQIVNAIAERATSAESDTGQRFKRHYHDGFYAHASAISHGGQGAINEIVRLEPHDNERPKQVWIMKRPDELKVIAHAQIAFQSWQLLFTLTRFSPIVHNIDVDGLLDRWKTFDAPLLAFKNAHIAAVGYEQAALDFLGT
jgi:hypothetical protein